MLSRACSKSSSEARASRPSVRTRSSATYRCAPVTRLQFHATTSTMLSGPRTWEAWRTRLGILFASGPAGPRLQYLVAQEPPHQINMRVVDLLEAFSSPDRPGRARLRSRRHAPLMPTDQVFRACARKRPQMLSFAAMTLTGWAACAAAGARTSIGAGTDIQSQAPAECPDVNSTPPWAGLLPHRWPRGRSWSLAARKRPLMGIYPKSE
jgi:hypothetical protein